MKRNSIAKNSVYNIIYKGFTALFPLITTAYIARVLLPDGVGKISYANTIVEYFTFLASLGIPNYGVKLIAKSRKSKYQLKKSLLELLIINFVSTSACLLIYYGVINYIPYFDDKRKLMNVMGSLLFLNYFNIDWFYQGIEEFGYIAIRSIIVKIISLGLILLFVKDKGDYIIYGLILCLSTAGNYLFNFFHTRKYINSYKVTTNVFQHLKPIFILLAASVATEIYTMLDTVMLEYFHNDSAVGYYTNSVKIIRMVYTVTVAMVAVFYPRISAYYSEKKTSKINELLTYGTKLIIVIGLPAAVGVFVLANGIVIVLFGNMFQFSTIILQILSILTIIFSIAYLLGHVVLMATGNESIILKATICGAVINALLNLILIPNYSGVGAAIASVTAELTVTIVMLFSSRKEFTLDIPSKFCFSTVFSCLIMGGILYAANLFFTINSVYMLLLMVFVGVCIYTACLYMTKNQMLLFFIGKMKGVK